MVALMFTLNSRAQQIQVSTAPPYDNPINLLRNVLVGTGVQVSNVTFYGNPKQIGYFSNGASSVTMNRGVVFSTGNVEEIVPPQINPLGISTKWPAGANQGKGDADLLKIARTVPPQIGQSFDIDTTYDGSILEFDLIPYSDTLTFRYVFASEEYLRYVNTKYNDIFAFFISGPGILGSYTSPPGFPDSAINIGKVPGFANLPITVSTINDRFNQALYVNNPGNNNIVFNGFTVVLTATAVVQPCQKYHLKIAIADGYANDFDSGILLESGSLNSGTVNLYPEIKAADATGAAREGCFTSGVVVRRDKVKAFNDTVYVSIGTGSQANVADISALPPYIIIPAGRDSVVFNFSVFEDLQLEGREKLVLNFHLLTSCVDILKSVDLELVDAGTLQFYHPGNKVIPLACYDNGADLNASVFGGYGFYKFNWSENGVPIAFSDSIYHVDPTSTTDYSVVVSDTCGMTPVTFTIRVIPASVVPLSLDLPDPVITYCKGKSYTFTPEVISGGGKVTNYRWYLNGSLFSTDSAPTIVANIGGQLVLSITDSCGTTAIDTTQFQVNQSPPIVLNVTSDTTLCQGQSLTITANASGGTGQLNYYWVELNDNNPSIFVSPQSTTDYQLIVTDDCPNTKMHKVYVKVNEIQADFEYTYLNTFEVDINNYSIGRDLRYDWYFDGEYFASQAEPPLVLKDMDNHLLNLRISDSNGCIDSLSEVILPPFILYMPNVFTPNGDGINDVFNPILIGAVEFEMTIVDRWGNIVFTTKDQSQGWNGVSVESGKILEGTYTVVVRAARNHNTRLYEIGKVFLLN